MKYALGNMLNGAGGLNADQLALDLQFAEDKTLTARKGPTPIFTRASSGTFVGSNGIIQSAGNNVARFDHNPVTLESRGLLIEESRTNLLIRSAELTSTAWTIINLTGTSVLAPDGTNTATSFNDGAVMGEHGVYGSFSPSNRPTTGAVSCTFSCFLKAGTVRYVSVNVTNFSNSVGMLVDTQTWQVVDAKAFGTGWTYTSSKLTDYGSGWYRAELTFTPPAATPVIPRISGAQSSTYSAVSPSYTGTNSTIIVWGAQLEAGSFATSYIPTTTSSVVRSADVCSISGTDFTGIWNYDEGTIYAAFDQSQSNVFGAILTAARSDDTGKVQIGRATSSQIYLAIKNNANLETFIYNPTSSIAAGLNKSALAYKVNDSIGTINNLSSPLDTSVSLGTPERLLIANDSVGSGRRHNGTISAVRVYKKRLPLSKLQTLTAP